MDTLITEENITLFNQEVDKSEWFKNLMIESEKDPRSHAEYALLDLENKICKIHGQPKGIYSILFWILGCCSDKLIWRKQKSNAP